MGRIDHETVQRILDRADIVEVVSDFVKLRRAGANYKGLCPFHNERTPSFSVSRSRNICKCFSCGKGGTPVNFIMEHEQLTYNEALRYLARKYNIEIVEKDMTDAERQAQSDREAMLAVNEFALTHFKKNLLEHPDGIAIAMPYFRHRGLTDAMIKRFHLGYAIDRGDDLLKAATAAGFNTEYLLRTGLAGESERDGHKSFYDRFRGRVIFPVHSVSGRVIAFGARTMRSDKTVAKYVNSPESEIYKKNLELYGFFQAKTAIARHDKAILVEGYLDVISMHQAGVENVVASSGTSLTEGQIRAIRRFTNNVTLIYDADPAGIKASLRGIKMLLGENMNVKVLLLPPGDDPDSFAQSHSSTEVEHYLDSNEVDVIAFMTDILMRDVDSADPTARAKVVNEILATVAYVDEPVKRQEYISNCSRMLGIREEVLIRQLNIFITRRYEENEKTEQRKAAGHTVGQIEAQASAQAVQPAGVAGQQPSVSDTEAPLLDLDVNHLKPCEEMLARYLVRYGVAYVADLTDDEGNIMPGTVYDLISNELAVDGITFTHKPYEAIFRAVGELRNGPWIADRRAFEQQLMKECGERLQAERQKLALAGGTVESLDSAERKAVDEIEKYRIRRLEEFDMNYIQSRLANSPDDTVRPLANELATERYTLSRIYERQGGVETEEQQLRHLVPRAVNELRAAIVRDILARLKKQLALLPSDDTQRAMEIMAEIVRYNDYQKRLVKVLGERIILPSL